MKLQDLIEAAECLEFANENLNLCKAEVMNELILEGLSPYNYHISPAYQDAARNVAYWNKEVMRLSKMPLIL